MARKSKAQAAAENTALDQATQQAQTAEPAKTEKPAPAPEAKAETAAKAEAAAKQAEAAAEESKKAELVKMRQVYFTQVSGDNKKVDAVVMARLSEQKQDDGSTVTRDAKMFATSMDQLKKNDKDGNYVTPTESKGTADFAVYAGQKPRQFDVITTTTAADGTKSKTTAKETMTFEDIAAQHAEYNKQLAAQKSAEKAAQKEAPAAEKPAPNPAVEQAMATAKAQAEKQQAQVENSGAQMGE